jgi:hypothetical protein
MVSRISVSSSTTRILCVPVTGTPGGSGATISDRGRASIIAPPPSRFRALIIRHAR